MNRTLAVSVILLLSLSVVTAQDVKSARKNPLTNDASSVAVVIDERLSVLRAEPSLYAKPLKRLISGTQVSVTEDKSAEGVLFYKVADRTAVVGWIQAEAIAGIFRKNDDQRLFQLILGSNGFAQVQRASIFLDLFPDSALRPTILLLLGDILEEAAAGLTRSANEKLVRTEMAAAKAPLHSFYLNFSEIDRYRDLGIRFLFNGDTLELHYDGESWFELTRSFPESPLTIEARERITSLTEKMKAKE